MVSKELKEERRAQGLCVYCGRPAVIKVDGTPARRCELCSGSHVSQKYYARHGNVKSELKQSIGSARGAERRFQNRRNNCG